MIAALAELADLGQSALLAGFVVFLRVGAAMAMLPAFGEQSVPQRVRLVLALAFTLVVMPAVADRTGAFAQSAVLSAPFLAAEALVGLIIGAGLRLMVLVLHMAGTIAAQSTSLSQLFASAGAEPMPAMAHLMLMGGLALAVMSGLHVQLAQMLIQSYELFPPGRFPSAPGVAEWGTGQAARSFALAFGLAAPFVIASFLYNVALGVINRAMPQLMVSFVGAPALTLGGLVLLMLALPPGLRIWADAFALFLGDPYGPAR